MCVFLTSGLLLEDHNFGFLLVNCQGPGLTEFMQEVVVLL